MTSYMTCFDEFARRWILWSEEFEEKLVKLWEKNMPVYMTYGNQKVNKNRTDLLRTDWLYAVQLGTIVGDS